MLNYLSSALLLILGLALAACHNPRIDDFDKAESFETAIKAPDLSNQRVTAFAEDVLGYVWIGTFRGLNRYNSHDYLQFFCTDLPDDLPDNQINYLFKDSKQRLWVATISGIARHTSTDKYQLAPFGEGRAHVHYVFEMPDGRVMALGEGRLGVFNEDTHAFDILIDSRKHAFRDYRFGTSGPGGNIWLCAPDAIDIYDSTGSRLIDSLPLDAQALTFYRCPIRGYLWVGTSAGVKTFDMVSRKPVPLPTALAQNTDIAHGYCNIIHRYDDKSLLFNSGTGLYFYNHATDGLLRPGDEGYPFDVPAFINTLYTDRNGNLWIGSYDKGFVVRSTGKKRFNDNHFLASNTSDLSINSVASDSKDRLWMITFPTQLLLYDGGTGRFVHNLDPYGDGTTVYVDPNDNIWLASLLSGKVRRYAFDGSRLNLQGSYDIDRPMAFASDVDGNVWVSSWVGKVTRISASDGSQQSVDLPTGSSAFVSSITPKGRKMIAAALMSPLYEIDIDELSVVESPISRNNWRNTLKRSVFIPTHIIHDSYDDLWIGTVGNGLLRYHAENDSLEHMHGLPCTDISSVVEDRQGNIWVSSMHGLSSYDRTTGRFTNYFTSDGTGGNQYYDRAACILSDGFLVFGATHGLTSFNPLDVVAPREIPLVFDGLKIHNVAVDPSQHPEVIASAMPTKPHITLNHDQNGFGISYAALDYENSEHSHYFYMLDGHDHFWVDARNSNEANYSNLPAGNYTFRVRASFGDSTDAYNEIAIPLTIKPAPWLSWWAITLYIFAALAVAYFGLRLRARYLTERHARRMAETERAQQQRLNDMNMSFFANISHEFRTPLTMISGPIAQLEASDALSSRERRMVSVVKHNVSRMLKLINQLMDFNKLENDTLQLQVEHIDLMVYLRHIAESFAVNSDEKGISLHTFGLEEPFVTWVDIDKIEKISTNLLSNSLKHTPSGGAIDLAFDVVDGAEAAKLAQEAGIEFHPAVSCMKITVSDTGPGIPPESLHRIFDRYFQLRNQQHGRQSWGTGIGLYYSRALATLHHGVLFAENRKDGKSGSIFTLLLPLGPDAYAADEHITAEPPLSQEPRVKSQEKSPNGATYPSPGCQPWGQESMSMSKSKSDASSLERTVLDASGVEPSETILVVDDDTDVIRYLRELLSPQYTVLTAFDAESALKIVADEHPDLVVSDVVMPGTDGYDLCRRIKEDIQVCHTPVILVTAMATIENQVQGLNTGADAYVTKPFDPQYLLALIHSQLENRRRARSIISNATETSDIAPDVLTGADKAFMNQLYELMQAELSNSELDITLITDRLHISRTKLFYKIKALTGETPGAFFKTYKLNRAAELIREGSYTMSEIADMTGFSTQAHFSTSFKKHFGVSPSAFASDSPQ